MQNALKSGFSFGLTSGVITTLGLMVGLVYSTDSKLAVVAGIITIAVADACSDALGMHISQEAENIHTTKQVWQATGSTFIAKLLVALTFLAPVVFLPLMTAVVLAVAWGLLLIIILSYLMARQEKVPPYKVIGEHLAIAVLVIIATKLVGDAIRTWF